MNTQTKSIGQFIEQNILTKYFSGNAMNYREIIRIFIPVFIDQMFITVLALINTTMISSSGMAAVSAVSMVDSLNIFLVNVFVAVSIGGTVVVAQFKGSGNDKMVAKSAAGSISSAFLLSALLSIILIVFHMPILNVLFGAAEKAVFESAKIYIIGSAISYAGIAISEAVCGALRGIGETKSSLIISLILNVSYLLLNVLFINILHMGVLGMSISIITARVAGAVFALYYITHHTQLIDFHLKDLFHIDLSVIKKISYIGLPFALEQMFFNGGKIVTQTFIVALGTDALTVNAICNSIAGLFQIHANSLAVTLVTVVGQSIGRKDVADARKFIKSFIWLSSILFVVSSLLILPLFRPIVSLFNPPDRIVSYMFYILLTFALFQIPIWSMSFVLPSALRAAGDSKFTSIVSMLSMWFFRVVLGYLLGIVFKIGVYGIWLAMDIEWGVRALVFMIRFRGKKWYAHNLTD